eukprot:6123744-Prymnesium_polylepis.1
MHILQKRPARRSRKFRRWRSPSRALRRTPRKPRVSGQLVSLSRSRDDCDPDRDVLQTSGSPGWP